MNIEDFKHKDINKDISRNNLLKNAVSNFIYELSSALNNTENKNKEEIIKDIRKFRKNR